MVGGIGIKDTEVMRMLYHNSEAFNVGIEVGKKEVIDKAYEYAKARYDLDYCGNIKDILNYPKSLVEE